MRTIKGIAGLLIGGLSALLGVSILSGCSEEEAGKTEIKPTKDQIENCCGKDDGSKRYEQCIASYQQNGVCSGNASDEPMVEKYGPYPVEPFPPTVYGPAPVDPGIKACCGEDDGSAAYNDCVADYKAAGHCDIVQADYGMPSVDPDIEECCGEDDGSEAYNRCVADYKATGQCDIVQADYGMPSVDPGIEKCCGEDDGSEAYASCVNEYKYNGCPPMPAPAYGMPVDPCCGEDDGSEAYSKCIENYAATGSCMQIDEPTPTVYGPNPATSCCKDVPADEYQKCIEDYEKSGVCAHGPEEPSMEVYGPAPVTPNDIAACCGEQNDSENYKECVDRMINNGECPVAEKPVEPDEPVES